MSLHIVNTCTLLLATPNQPTEARPPDSVQDAVAGLIVNNNINVQYIFMNTHYFGNLIIVLHH